MKTSDVVVFEGDYIRVYAKSGDRRLNDLHIQIDGNTETEEAGTLEDLFKLSQGLDEVLCDLFNEYRERNGIGHPLELLWLAERNVND